MLFGVLTRKSTPDENGNLTAISNGVVTITVHSSNGLEDTMEFNIVKSDPIINPNTGVKSVIFEKNGLNLYLKLSNKNFYINISKM